MALNALTNVFRIAELRRRLAYTLALLAVYRLGIFITTPGVDRAAMNAFMEKNQAQQGLLSLFNMFSGGGLEQMSIFGLGIMPYVSASIIIQMLAYVVPTLERLQKEGAVGRQKLNQYTRYGTILLSIVQGIGVAKTFASVGRTQLAQRVFANFDQVIVPNDNLWYYFMTVVSLTAGTAFIMWLGERITERGIGNGISLIIFAGIVARIPSTLRQLFHLTSTKTIEAGIIVGLAILVLVIIAVVVFVERGMRRIPIQYAKRVVGRQALGGHSTYFPIKVNSAGVIPPIFASAILSFPLTFAGWFPILHNFQYALGNLWVYDGLFSLLIIGFTYFYTGLVFRTDDVADNVKKQGGYVPGIRPGRQTAEYFDRVLNRITFGGAVYLASICVLPSVIRNLTSVDLRFGGTAVLIVVGVALDTVQQIEGHLITRNYEGFAGPRGPRIRGRSARIAA